MGREYSIEHIIGFGETNVVGNVYFAEYFRWQGICRERFLFQHASETVAAVADGSLALVTLDCRAAFHNEAYAGDRINIAMRVAATAAGRVTMTFRYVRDSLVLATGEHSIACYRRTSHGLEATSLPDDLEAALENFR